MNPTDLKNHLLKQREKLEEQVAKLTSAVVKKENKLLSQEMALTQGQGPGSLVRDLSGMPVFLMPGNVGDINKVIWPSAFPTDVAQIAPNQNVTTGFSVSKTAGFILTHYAKVVYLFEDLGMGDVRYTYFDPDDPAGAGDTPNLSFSWRNSSSTRDYTNTTIPIDGVGNPRWPTYLRAPQLVMPNQNIEVTFFNDDPTDTYRAALIFYGIRLRVDDSYDILSTVFAEGADGVIGDVLNPQNSKYTLDTV